jgi:hypothetical protein
MKSKWSCLFAVVAVAFGLSFSAVTPAAPAPKPAPAAAPAAPAAAPVPEPHPEIHDALDALRKAKFRMEHASHDFGGHREEAIRATDEAIRQLELCLKFDR